MPLKRNSFGAVGKIMLPNEGGKHIFKNLVSYRMKIQQNLKTVWKNLENIMTIDEEMKELSAKAAKASRKQEKFGNNFRFAVVFLTFSFFGPSWFEYASKLLIYLNILPARAGSTFLQIGAQSCSTKI